MKRKIASLLLCVALVLGICGMSASAAANAETRLEVVRVLGIMIGDENGNLMLDRSVTRAEFTKMMVAASPYKDSVTAGSGASLFTDVKTGHWAGGYISVAVEKGWMVGYVDGSFRPDRTITLEEGCTALLRVLGYDASALAGAYPFAQLSKAQSVGLRDELSCDRGHVLTRQDCVTLFYNLLVAKNSSGMDYGSTLGYTVKNGEIDYSALISADTKGPYVVEKGGLMLPFGTENVTVYRDGVLSDLSQVKLNDVYYYHQNLRTVWTYTQRITGVLSAVAPNPVTPTAVTVERESYTLGTSAAAYQVSAQGSFKEGDTVVLLLGMDDAVVKILPADIPEQLYYGMDLSSTEGPFVAANGTLDLPFGTENVTIYRNGVLSDGKQIAINDVYYYHQPLRTIWVYNDRAAGTLTAVSPNRYSPNTVTVAGVTYTLGTTEAIKQVSSQGTFRTGDTVVLLLAVDGTVVKILSAEENEQIYTGMVLSSKRESTSEDTATASGIQTATQVVTGDGTVMTFYHNSDEFLVGTVVCAAVKPEGTSLSVLNKVKLSGKMDALRNVIGDQKLAENITILDTDDLGNYVVVYPQRLAGCTLAEKNVLHYSLNDAGEIDSMILHEATGDMWKYGFVAEVNARTSSKSVSASYSIIAEGKNQTISGSAVYPVKQGGVVMQYEEGKLSSMYQLQTAKLSYITDGNAVGGNRQFAVDEDVQVVIMEITNEGLKKYYASTVSQINTTEYTLAGWYDDFGCPAGGRLRVIVAEPK